MGLQGLGRTFMDICRPQILQGQSFRAVLGKCHINVLKRTGWGHHWECSKVLDMCAKLVPWRPSLATTIGLEVAEVPEPMEAN